MYLWLFCHIGPGICATEMLNPAYIIIVVDWTGSNADMPRGPAQLLQESLTI